jgi:hypothetical protein|tara:strand:+ start:4559 stop:5020 length:462 start_codon:yes stop_codon:yes gene_type:complete
VSYYNGSADKKDINLNLNVSSMKWPPVNAASISAAITGGALLVSAILPHGEVDGMKLCPIFHLTGHECPFCGMSRGFVAITHFDIPRAIVFNPGSPLIYGAFIYMFWGSIQALRDGETALKPVSKTIYYSWLIPTILVFLFMFYQRVIKVFLL